MCDEAAFDVAEEGDGEHGWGDVDAGPVVAGFSEGLTGQAGAAADIEYVEGRGGGREQREKTPSEKLVGPSLPKASLPRDNKQFLRS